MPGSSVNFDNIMVGNKFINDSPSEGDSGEICHIEDGCHKQKNNRRTRSKFARLKITDEVLHQLRMMPDETFTDCLSINDNHFESSVDNFNEIMKPDQTSECVDIDCNTTEDISRSTLLSDENRPIHELRSRGNTPDCTQWDLDELSTDGERLIESSASVDDLKIHSLQVCDSLDGFKSRSEFPDNSFNSTTSDTNELVANSLDNLVKTPSCPRVPQKYCT